MLRAMSRLPSLIVIAVAITLCGCHDPELEKLRDVRNQVCKCETAECADAALGELDPHAKRTDHRAQAIANEMLTCLAKLYANGRPITDIDAEPDETPITSPGSSAPASGGTP